MAYSVTYDERTYGGYISGSAGSRDAPNDLNTLYVLAEGSVGFGALIQPDFYQADLDVYHLGNLGPGNYTLDVDGYNWDYGNSYIAGVNNFGVIDSNYSSLGQSYNEFTDVNFTRYSTTDVRLRMG